MKTLHLNLKRKWFDMILSGEKTEEYREIKDHWCIRLVGVWWNLGLYKGIIPDSDIDCYADCVPYKFNHFDTITFSNGYAKDRDQFEIEFKGIEIREGNLEWGAEKGVKYFVLKLGKIIEP